MGKCSEIVNDSLNCLNSNHSQQRITSVFRQAVTAVANKILYKLASEIQFSCSQFTPTTILSLQFTF